MYRAVVLVLLSLFSVTALAFDRVPLFDVDKDLHVNYVELSSKCRVSRQLFDRADTDHDKVLNKTEMRIAKGYLFSKCKKENKYS